MTLPDIPKITITHGLHTSIPFPEHLWESAKKYYKTQGYFQDIALDFLHRKPVKIKFKPTLDLDYIEDTIKYINILITFVRTNGHKKKAIISYLLSVICVKSLPGVESSSPFHEQVKSCFK